MPTSSPFGFTAMLCFLDMATHHVGLYFIKPHTGTEVLSALKQYMAEHRECFTDKGLLEWRTDNHGEFYNEESNLFCSDNGIKHTSIAAYNPQANPSERLWSTLLRSIRIMMAASNASECLWPFAAAQATQVHNSLTSRSVHIMDDGKTTPYQMATGRIRAAPAAPHSGRTHSRRDHPSSAGVQQRL